MATKKFTDLSQADALSANDIIAIVDDQNNSSKRITANDISNYVYSASVIGDPNLKANIISALNGPAVNPDNNGLRSGSLFYNGEYRSGAYFLDWANIQSKPTPVINNSGLANTEQFVSLQDEGVGTPKSLAVRNPNGLGGANERIITLDHIQNGTVNKFYNQGLVEKTIDDKFGPLFNTFSNVFDGGNVRDSLQDVKAEWDPSSANSSHVILVQDPDITIQNSFEAGQVLRVYGGSRDGAPFTDSVNISEIDVENGRFTTGSSGATVALKFRYKLAYFDLNTGKIARRSLGSAIGGTEPVIIVDSSGIATSKQDLKNLFNTSNFISVKLNPLVADRGVAVWRQEDGVGSFELVAVLGPKDFKNGTWRDYYNFDYTSWSGKNPDNNTYYSAADYSEIVFGEGSQEALVGGRSVIHFPQSLSADLNMDSNSNAETMEGWVDVTIEAVENLSQGTIKLTVGDLQNEISINGTSHQLGNTCYLVHNDTTKLQNAITSKSQSDQRSLNLNAKTYNATHLSIPSFFGLTGVPGITKIRKLPFSGYTSTDTQDNSLIRGLSDEFGPAQISLLGVDLDGNGRNQYLLGDDAGGGSGNTFIDFGVFSTGILIQNCRIKNLVGGGIKASSPTAFKMVSCELSDSAMTDRHEFSPLIVDDGENSIITGNLIQNFTNFIDASVTKQGVIANNIIKNLTGNVADDDDTKDLGSAIFTYGSTFLVSSPNVMMGPSNEFLSSPDILNSEYDAVNILRGAMQQSSEGGNPYTSDVFVYQENGNIFDLTQTAVSGSSEIVYRTNLIRKLGNTSNSTEEVYGNEVGPSARDIRNNAFSGSSFGLVSGYTYKIHTVGNCDWSKAGAVYNSPGHLFVYNGNALEQKDNTNAPTTGKVTFESAVGYDDAGSQPIAGATLNGGVVTATAHGLVVGDRVAVAETSTGSAPQLVAGTYVISAVTDDTFSIPFSGTAASGATFMKVVYQDTLQFDDIVSETVDKTRGEFKFNISDNIHGSLSRILTGGFSEGALHNIYESQIKATESDITRIHPVGSYHIGIAWSASYKYAVTVGTPFTTGVWSDYFRLDANGKDTENAGGDDLNIYGGEEHDPSNAFRIYRDFTLTLSSPQFLTKGMIVEFNNKENFSPGSALNNKGVLINIGTGTSTQRTVTIRYYGTGSNAYNVTGLANDFPSTDSFAGESNGTLNIIDDFVMAQGLIK